MTIYQATPDALARATSLLHAGGIVAFPTETVYGLGALAGNNDAVAAIFAAKKRPATSPISILCADTAMAAAPVIWNDTAALLASVFWPGPLTLVLPLRQPTGIAPLVTAGTQTLGVRVPDHPVALALIRAVNQPIAAPSANPSGHLSPTTAQQVAAMLPELPLILSDGASAIGLESTLVDLSGAGAVIRRLGAIPQDAIEGLIGTVTVAAPTEGHQQKPFVMQTPLRLNAVDAKAHEAFLAFGSTRFIAAEGVGFAHDLPSERFINLSPTGDLHEAAAHLYGALQTLDQAGATAIAVQPIPSTGLGVVINDRLRRMARS